MTQSTIKIAVAGAAGRMGRMLIEAILCNPKLELVGALDQAGAPQVGEDAGAFLGKKNGHYYYCRYRARPQSGRLFNRLYEAGGHPTAPRLCP